MVGMCSFDCTQLLQNATLVHEFQVASAGYISRGRGGGYQEIY